MSRPTKDRSVVPRPSAPPLQGAVRNALMSSGYADLAIVACEVANDRVVLHGEVHTWHLKQLAQSIVKRVAGVGRIENLLHVRREAPTCPGSSPASGDRATP